MVRSSESEPTPIAILKRSENVRNFQSVKRPQVGLALSLDCAIKSIYKDPLSVGTQKGCSRTNRASGQHVVGRLINGYVSFNHGLSQVGSHRKIGPTAVKRMGSGSHVP